MQAVSNAALLLSRCDPDGFIELVDSMAVARVKAACLYCELPVLMHCDLLRTAFLPHDGTKRDGAVRRKGQQTSSEDGGGVWRGCEAV
jgi:hypothetical protein